MFWIQNFLLGFILGQAVTVESYEIMVAASVAIAINLYKSIWGDQNT